MLYSKRVVSDILYFSMDTDILISLTTDRSTIQLKYLVLSGIYERVHGDVVEPVGTSLHHCSYQA